MAVWNSAAHPRNTKGPAGGEFKGGKASSKQAAPAKKRSSGTAHGSMSFNGKTGTGYGSKNGDARVKKLQEALNKLGMKDANGNPLVIDGKLGPKTTAAIKRWQKKNGMKPDGVVTPKMLSQATTRTHKKATLARKKAPAKSRSLVMK